MWYVLSAIPVYYMSVFKMPQWVLDEIDKIRLNFLWYGVQHDRKKIHLANWPLVCTPKNKGGLGVIDLKAFNLTLLTKWQWQWFQLEPRMWKSIFNYLYGEGSATDVSDSFFFSQHLRPI